MMEFRKTVSELHSRACLLTHSANARLFMVVTGTALAFKVGALILREGPPRTWNLPELLFAILTAVGALLCAVVFRCFRERLLFLLLTVEAVVNIVLRILNSPLLVHYRAFTVAIWACAAVLSISMLLHSRASITHEDSQ